MSTYPPLIRKRRVAALRAAAGLTQFELATAAGISTASLSAMERGMSAPTLLEAVAQVLKYRDKPERLLDFVDLVVPE